MMFSYGGSLGLAAAPSLSLPRRLSGHLPRARASVFSVRKLEVPRQERCLPQLQDVR